MKFRPILLLTFCIISTSGCLKSRYSLRGDEDEGAPKQMPAKVEEVQPAGGYAVEEVKAELARQTGRIEDLERSQKSDGGKVNAATREEMKKLENRIAELEQAQAQMIETIKKLQESPAPAADAGAAFEKGKKQFEAGEFEGAIEHFSAYLKTPKAKKAEEATFLRAEAHYKLKQYKKAIVDYSKFPEKFTKSKLMAQSLYKIGLSFDGMGMHDDAKGFYQELVEKFPKSSEAKKARPKLR